MAKKSGKSAKADKVKRKLLKQKITAATAKTAGEDAGAPKQLPRLPSAWRLTRAACITLWRQRKLFIGITLIYGLLNLVLVRGLASTTDVGSLKHSLNQAFSGDLGSVASSLGVFAVLVGSAGNGSSQTAGAYQLFLGLITSLAVIWALRQVLAGKPPRIRDAYYLGMYPLIPFILVLIIIGLQLLPLLIGSTLYSVVITNGIAVTVIEKLLCAAIFIALALLSLYWLSSSIFALYIVTLPDMAPLKALRSAKDLVRGRRWAVLRKLLFLPVILLVAAAIIMIPIILVVTPAAQWIFFVLTMFGLVAIHAYIYTFYRELLNE
jgi:hypothetical protein